MADGAPDHARSEVRDGMRIDWHTPITVDDGNVLRADVYRPVDEGRFPVILSYGPYGKGVSFQSEIYAMQWERLISRAPEVLEGSTNKYQAWEVVDPERWVPHGYAVVRVDSRGAGWSPGYMDPRGPREVRDAYECVEWAARQDWSSGRVGMAGISYYAIMAWLVAAARPPHLAAIIAWEGYTDFYRGPTHHGGIRSEFYDRWWAKQVTRVQYGIGERGLRNPNTGEPTAGPVTLTDEQLEANRINFIGELKARRLDSDWYRERSADVGKITIPMLSAANWGGQGLHPTGNHYGFIEAASDQKWFEAHGDTHYTHFYSSYGLGLQRRFFDHFLKGVDTGWECQPRVQLNIRHPGERFVLRAEDEWPLARTQWTKFYLDAATSKLEQVPPAEERSLGYDALGDGLLFSLPPRDEEMEITGPIAGKLFISSSTPDADLFLVLRLFDPGGAEVTFEGSTDPNTPIANGWLRASHRRLDPERSRPYRPYHPHDRVEPLEPGEIYEVDVEIWPSCIVVPPGYRLALSVRGKDYEYDGPLDEFGRTFHYATRGTGGMTHDDPDDRPAEIFGGRVTVHSGARHPSHLLLPVIPEANGA